MTSSVACDSVSPKRLKVLTWNVNSDEGDGVAPLRLRAIVAEVESSAADVVFLQEVTVPFKSMLQLQLGSTYHFEDLSAETAEQFFVMVMLRSDRVEKVKSERVDFRDGGTSCMGRYILRIEVRFAGSPASVSLMTSHLESCKQNSQTRMLQYEQLLRLIIEAPANQLQLCCGDFNLREAEDRMVRKRLKASGVDADAAVDSFDAAGRPLDASSTWSRIMDKTQTATSVKARFDRQLFRPGSTAFSLWNGSFKLLGTDIVPGIDESIVRSSGFATPSDHMGILCEYTCGPDRAALLPLEVNAFAECVEHAPRTQCSVIIVLVGAPGSGKSTLAALLSPGFVRVSQDELGGRRKCEDAAKAALQHGSNVVVDRCNFDSQQRSTWLSIAHKFSARAVAVLLDVPLNVCLHRVAARRGHEGGVQGNSETAIDIVTKIHVSLKCVEGDEGFSRIHVFQHTTSPQEIAVELTAAYGTPATSHHFRPTPVLSHPSTRPLRFSSSAQPVGVQCDSSSSESSQERDGSSPAPLFSSAAASARLPEQTQTQSSAAPVVAEEADAYGDDCVLVQHVPSRSKRPLPGILSSDVKRAKVKSDPDAEVVQTSSTVDAPPAKKGRGRAAKTPAQRSEPLPPKENEQHTDAALPLAPPIATKFQFTADTLLKAATLYLATHPFLEPQTTTHAVDQQQSQQVAHSTVHMSQSSNHAACSFTSQADAEDYAGRRQAHPSDAADLHSSQQSWRFDLESALFNTDSVSSFSATRTSSSNRSENTQPEAQVKPLLSSQTKDSDSWKCPDIMSDDFETNFMSSLLPRPRSTVAVEAATSRPAAPARDIGAGMGSRWNSQFSGSSLKEIADMLCTSTQRT